jgi:WD40 repeat protein
VPFAKAASLQAMAQWGSLRGHTQNVQAVEWAPDVSPSICMSAGKDASLRIWDLTGNRLIAAVPTRAKIIHVAASLDGRYYSSGTMDDVVTLYDARMGGKVLSHTSLPLEANAQRWTPSGDLEVACGLRDGREGGVLLRLDAGGSPPEEVKVVKLGAADAGLREIQQRQVLLGAARVLRASRDNSLYAVGGVDSNVALFSGETDVALRCVEAGSAAVTGVDLSHDASYLAIATRQAPVRIVRSGDGLTVRDVAGTEKNAVAPVWHPSEDVLAIFADDDESKVIVNVLRVA